MAKVYAAQVKFINREVSEKALACTVQVYGWYDSSDPSTLHQRTPVTVNLWIPRDYELAGQLYERCRLAVPAMGIIAEGKVVTGKRGQFEVFNFAGVETRNVTMISELSLQDDAAAYVKSGTSLVVAAASESVVSKLSKLVKAFF